MNNEIKLIKTKKDYKAALALADKLFDSVPNMIRRISAELGIPAEVLIQPYDVIA